MTFEEWVKKEWGDDTPFPGQYGVARKAWNAALAAEREAEIAALQAELVESQREKEACFDCHAGPGTTLPACGACVTCLLREVDTLQDDLEASQGWNTANIREAAIARDRYRAAETKLAAAERALAKACGIVEGP
jgi:hypothetical protein